MKRVLQVLVGSILTLVAVIAVALIAARFGDGPSGIIAGGPFTSGDAHRGPAPDWSFVKDIDTIELQTLNPKRSRTTWVLHHGGRLFIPCGYMDSAWGKIWKQWPLEAERDGRAITRIDGALYNHNLVRIKEGDVLEGVLAELSRKYVGAPIPLAAVASGSLWIFELTPRA